MERQTHKAMLEFPEVRMAVSKIGRPDIAFGPEEPNESDPIVSLRDRSTWTTATTQPKLTDAIRTKLAEIPGISVLMSQPIQERVDELISGIRTMCAIKLYGADLDVLHEKAEEIAALMQQIKGVKDIKVEQIAGQPYLTVGNSILPLNSVIALQEGATAGADHPDTEDDEGLLASVASAMNPLKFLS